jgi:hypothetical protein
MMRAHVRGAAHSSGRPNQEVAEVPLLDSGGDGGTGRNRQELPSRCREGEEERFYFERCSYCQRPERLSLTAVLTLVTGKTVDDHATIRAALAV